MAPKAQEKHNHDEITRKVKKDTLHRVKFPDGLDEVTHVVKEIADEINEVGNLFGSSIELSVTAPILMPLAIIGAIASVRETREIYEEIEKIGKAKISAREKLQRLSEASEVARRFIEAKLSGKKINKNKLSPKRILAAKDLQEVAGEVLKYNETRNKQMMARLSFGYQNAETIAMTAVAAGSAAAIASSAYEIKAALASSEELEIAAEASAHIAEKVAESFLIVGQVAMLAYSGFRFYKGSKIMARLKEKEDALEKYYSEIGASDDTKAHIKRIIAKQKKYVNKHSVQYAKFMGAGQIVGLAGTSLILTGAGTVATAPVLAIAAIPSAYASYNRAVFQSRENKLTGKDVQNCAYNHEINANNNVITALFEKMSTPQDPNNPDAPNKIDRAYKEVTQKAESDLKTSSQALAYTKIFSILQHINNNKKYRNLSAEQKIYEIDRIFTKLEESLRNDENIEDGKKYLNVKNGFFRRDNNSRIEKEVLLIISQTYKNHKEEINAAFSSKSREDINKTLVQATINVMQDQKKALEGSNNEIAFSNLGEEITVQNGRKTVESLAITGDYFYEKRSSASQAKKLIKHAKLSCKALRYKAADDIMSIATCKKNFDMIKEEQDLYQTPPPTTINVTEAQNLVELAERENTDKLKLGILNVKIAQGTDLHNDYILNEEDTKKYKEKLEEEKKNLNKTINKEKKNSSEFLQPEKYSGIGVNCQAFFNKKTKTYYFIVKEVFEGSPAQNKGIAIGDKITTSHKDFKKAVNAMRNFENVRVFDEQGDPKDIKIPSVMLRQYQQGVGVDIFTSDASKAFTTPTLQR